MMIDLEKLCDELALIAWNSEPQNARTIYQTIKLLVEQNEIIKQHQDREKNSEVCS